MDDKKPVVSGLSRGGDAERSDQNKPAAQISDRDKQAAMQQMAARAVAERAFAEMDNAKPAPRPPMMKFWQLTPVDPQEPPFFHTGVHNLLVVCAESAVIARSIAAGSEKAGDAWADPKLSHCEELPLVRGVVARDLTG